MSEENKVEAKQKQQKRKIIIPIAIGLGLLAGVYLIHESQFQTTDDAYVEADY